MVTVETVPVSRTSCRSSQDRIGTAPSLARRCCCSSSDSSSALEEASRRRARCSDVGLHRHGVITSLVQHLTAGQLCPTAAQCARPRPARAGRRRSCGSSSGSRSPGAIASSSRRTTTCRKAVSSRLDRAVDVVLQRRLTVDDAAQQPARPLDHPHPGRLVALLAVRGGDRQQPAQLDPERSLDQRRRAAGLGGRLDQSPRAARARAAAARGRVRAQLERRIAADQHRRDDLLGSPPRPGAAARRRETR